MYRLIWALLFPVSLLASTASPAAKPLQEKSTAQALKTAVNTMAQQAATPPGQTKKKAEHDQGDDNASNNAILKVCSKNTPAATRSAICPKAVSPP
jgi:hypothetical protein